MLIGNVFTHTDEGTGYMIRVSSTPNGLTRLVVDDDGSGFAGAGSMRRGHSSIGSTGLGLDIVARTAERSGGSTILGSSPSGGARVEVVFGKPWPEGADGATKVAASPLR